MPEPKAQLIDPQGPIDVPGINATGIITATGGFAGNVQGAATGFAATTYNLNVGIVTGTKFQGNTTGNVSGLADDTNINVGIITSTSFTGDLVGNAAGLSTTTANINAGIMTATSFAGNFTGLASGITGTPNVVAGIVTASQFVGNTPGLAGGISAGKNLAAGIVTATTFYGDGSALTGAGSTAFIRQTATASVSATINLNLGNIVYFVHDANATISFSNVGTVESVTIIRTISDNTLSWPGAVKWNGGSAPSLSNDPSSNTRFGAGQVFHLNTADGGTTWYAYEEYDYNPEYFATWSWGYNLITGIMGASGLLTPPNQRRSSPTQIPGTVWTKKFSLRDAAYGIKDDGTLWAMGQNTYGQLANNTHAPGWWMGTSSPIQIPGTNWASVEAHSSWANATKTDGTLWGWGANSSGQLGQNNTVHYSSPVQVPGTTWQTLLKGAIAGAIKTDGTLWNWGGNAHGVLGHNESPSTRTGYSSPVQINSDTDWKGGTSGGIVNFMWKTTGELKAVGYNSEDRILGLNSGPTVSRSSPVAIPGTTWSRVVSYNTATLALKTNGTLWSWGDNEMGQLGYGPTPDQTGSPKQVGTETTWIDLANMSESSMGVKSDGTLWTWGANEGGELGHNITGPAPTTKVTSPKQIPGTNWKACFAGDRVMFAFQEPS